MSPFWQAEALALFVALVGFSIPWVTENRFSSRFAREMCLSAVCAFGMSGTRLSACHRPSFASIVSPPYYLSIKKGDSGNPAQHSLGHVPPCPGCEQMRRELMQGRLSPDQSFADASDAWLEARNFAGGKTRARFLAKGTVKCYADYLIPLKRHFGALRLDQIHAGTLRAYQELRATGQLGSSYEEVFARVCKWMRVSVIQAEDNPTLTDLINKRVEKIRHSEVGPNLVNKELNLLTQIMRSAGAWTAELEELYESLQYEENDIPKALTPAEQNHWLEVSASKPEWEVIHLYSVVAFRTTCSNVEMRNLRVGDVNLYAKTIGVQAATAKNSYRIRTIKLAPDAVWACERLLERGRELGSVMPHHYIFPFRDIATKEFIPDRPMGGTGLKKPWNAVREASGLRDFSPHDARHTAITRFAEAGTPMAVIMAMAGHISPRMTRHYTQISLQAQEWATQAVYNGTMYPGQTVKQAVPIRAHGVRKIPEQKFL